MDNLKIENYSNKYQSQVKKLVTSIHEEFGFSYDYDLDRDLENPAKFYSDAGGTFLCLLNSDEVVGTVAVKKMDENLGELKRMYLLKEYRGKGWGKKLLEKAIIFCKQKGFSECQLDTTMKQVDAQKLYQKYGFKIQKIEGTTMYMLLDLRHQTH